MKKRIISLVLILALSFSLFGCVGSKAKTFYAEGMDYLYGLNDKELDLEAAYTNFQQALDAGYTDANFYLGVLCYCYNYPQHDYQQAREYFEACGDNSNALIALGLMYGDGNGVDEDDDYARQLFDKALEQGSADANYGLGVLAYEDKDHETAMQYYTAALDGSEQRYVAKTMNYIGRLYQNGYGVEQDYAAAMEWYQKAVDLENSNAMYNIGSLYQNGYGVEQDYAAAMEWFEKAADLENSHAMNNIGWLYYKGYGVEQDYAAAMEWYEKAAELENSYAMHNIGWLYQNGYGVKENIGTAKRWYQKAADLGNTVSMFQLGWICAYATSMHNYSSAMEWWEQAAELGNETAMDAIGYLYYYGRGVDKDYATALEWFEKAVDAGYDSSEMVEELSKLVG